MRNRSYDKGFKLDCIKYCAEYLELSQADAARNLMELTEKNSSRKIKKNIQNKLPDNLTGNERKT